MNVPTLGLGLRGLVVNQSRRFLSTTVFINGIRRESGPRTRPAPQISKSNRVLLQYRSASPDISLISLIMHSIDNIRYQDLFEINRSITRGHEYKIHKQFCRTNSRKFTFSRRIIIDWNSLPSSVAHSKDVNRFKLGIDKFFEGHTCDI